MPQLASRPMASLAAVLVALAAASARGQESAREPLQLLGAFPAGVRMSVTESRGTLKFTVTNSDPDARDARVLVYYEGRRDVQYGRDVWVPGKSSVTPWLPVGPAADTGNAMGREIHMLLYDRTGGRERAVLPPGEERRDRTRAVAYRKREPTTAIILDPGGTDLEPDALARPESRAAYLLARTFRQAAGLSDHVFIVQDVLLPPTADAFDGTDHLVLAGNRLAVDPVGRAELRRWLQHGGKLWVMLDRVDPAVVAPILGDDFDLHVVDRVGLTTVTVRRQKDDSVAAPARGFEQPVEQVRVVPGVEDQVLHTVDGWPVSFVRQVGRGKVVFTTLGPTGWHQPQSAASLKGPNPKLPEPKRPAAAASDLPVPLAHLEEVAGELHSRTPPHPFTAEDLRPLLNEEIGYSIIGRGTVGFVLGAFLLALLALGLGLRRAARPELVGWLGPVAALAAAGVFLVLGESSRRAVPPTVGVAEIVEAVPGSGESASHGLFAMYQPSSGLASLGTQHGSALDLDTEGLEGQTLRRIQTDVDAWHWENLSLPAGVRAGPFRSTARTGRLTAVARFGPNGVEGRLSAESFGGLSDVLLSTPAREPIAARLDPDGRFAAGLDDALSPGQFLAGTVLTDRQQRRQAVYRQLLSGRPPELLEGRDLLMAWAEPGEIPFKGEDGARTVGTALLIIPMEFEHPPAGTRVTIPRAFVPFKRVTDGKFVQPTLESGFPTEMRLRFQLPASVLPLEVESATLYARVRTPGRRFTVSGIADGQTVPLVAIDSPAEPIRLEIADARLLRPDDRGGLHLNVAVTGTGESKWAIEALGLDVVGRTAER